MNVMKTLKKKGRMPRMPYLSYVELMGGLVLFIFLFAMIHLRDLRTQTLKVNTLISSPTRYYLDR